MSCPDADFFISVVVNSCTGVVALFLEDAGLFSISVQNVMDDYNKCNGYDSTVKEFEEIEYNNDL